MLLYPSQIVYQTNKKCDMNNIEKEIYAFYKQYIEK